MSNEVYYNKITKWLNDSEGKTPVYDKLISNLIKAMRRSSSAIDQGNHVIEFPTPLAIYDRALAVYDPANEFETMMFTNLLSQIADDTQSINVSSDVAYLGKGSDKSNWRYYVVVKVEFTKVDSEEFLNSISLHKDEIANEVMAKLANEVINKE